MALLKRNTYSKLVTGSDLTNAAYTPEKLWEKALEYIKWAEDNPLKEEKVFSSGKRLSVNKIRAMTLTGFCVFAHISKDVFETYAQSEGYAGVVARIKDVIYMQKFEGAAAGLLETSFVARELGLRDQTDITTNGKSISIEVVDEPTKTQLEDLRRRLEK
ncbi:DNA-packaging protein [Dysgonomonas sp. OttesenSCG-928-M03]|nr:DNA-packaging protein [Dysgonomonas sp. OttesenSCG-928-M03]